MKRNPLTAPLRFWRHLGYHREIIKHLRWTRGDARRFAFYQGLIRPGELVFDIGANMGNRSKIFRAIGARVVAFEPQSYCATFLRAAFSGDSDFILVQTAMSDCEGEQEMFLSDTHVLSTLNTDWLERMRQGGRFAEQHWDRSETVPLTTLDKAIERFGIPDFVKIDVEGHELKVIQGLSQPVSMLRWSSRVSHSTASAPVSTTSPAWDPTNSGSRSARAWRSRAMPGWIVTASSANSNRVSNAIH